MRFMKSAARLGAVIAALALLSCGLASPAMAVGVGGNGLNLTGHLQGTITQSSALGSTQQVLDLPFVALQFQSGTAGGEIDTFWAGSETIAASGSSTLTLQGSLTDAFSNSVSFGHVKMLLVTCASANTNSFQIGPGASNPFAGPWTGTTPLTAVGPGETMLITNGSGSNAGWAVTSSTDVIKIANSSSGTSVTCDVVIAGTST